LKRLLGLYRESQYSPGAHRSNDRLLLDGIGYRLRACDLDVELMTIEQVAQRPEAALVFSMCQGRAALDQLMVWEAAGATIINSPRAARNTHRDCLPQLMQRAGVAFPPTELIETTPGSNSANGAAGQVWLKRGDVHAAVAADVQRLRSGRDLAGALAEFRERGIRTAAIQAHCAGDELKFYGIGRGDFFYWYYSREPHGHSFDATALGDLACRAAEASGLDIYGGDVIVSPEGELTLIDLNDWPSFAPCREAACDAIANLIRRRVHAE
jgi:glutathione synthase/RimK-type ligase-like ATP-grasp enzyme